MLNFYLILEAAGMVDLAFDHSIVWTSDFRDSDYSISQTVEQWYEQIIPLLHATHRLAPSSLC